MELRKEVPGVYLPTGCKLPSAEIIQLITDRYNVEVMEFNTLRAAEEFQSFPHFDLRFCWMENNIRGFNDGSSIIINLAWPIVSASDRLELWIHELVHFAHRHHGSEFSNACTRLALKCNVLMLGML